MTDNPSAVLALMAGAFAGSLVSSFSGFALAPVAGVFLLTVFEPKIVVPLLMICSLLVQGATLIYLRRSLSFSRITIMLAGGAIGVAVAVPLFSHLESRTFQVGFGLLLAVYATIMLMQPSALGLRIQPPRTLEAGVGFLGGVIGALTAMPGAVPVIYCDLRGSSKNEQRATVQPFILSAQIFALTLLWISGEIEARVVGLVAAAIPALCAGTVVGLMLFGRAPDAMFRRVVLMLLLVTGFGLASRPLRQAPIASAASHDPACCAEILSGGRVPAVTGSVLQPGHNLLDGDK